MECQVARGVAGDGVVPLLVDLWDAESVDDVEYACVVLDEMDNGDGGEALGELVVAAFPEELGGFEVDDAGGEFVLLEALGGLLAMRRCNHS